MSLLTHFQSWTTSSDDEVIAWGKFAWFVWAPVALILGLGSVCTAAPHMVSRIIDGDTFETSDGQTVRIIGIDAPEQHEGARVYLTSLIEGSPVDLRFEGDRRDRYGRTLAYVHLQDGSDVGAKMIEAGYAMAYLKYPCSRSDDYLALEIEARKAARGIWDGHLTAEPRAPPAMTGDKATPEKGTTVYVTRTGSKYHRAGCRYLKKSKVPMTLGNARARYGACKVCKPPE